MCIQQRDTTAYLPINEKDSELLQKFVGDSGSTPVSRCGSHIRIIAGASPQHKSEMDAWLSTALAHHV
jgi:hypothetical protein